MDAGATVKREHRVQDFLPSHNGLKFTNRFPGTPLPQMLDKFFDTSKSAYGLCGGMCFTVIDFAKSRKQPPTVADVPGEQSKLFDYLKKRQIASFGLLDAVVLRFIYWMSLTDEKAQEETLDEWRKIRKQLDKHDFAVLGLIYRNFTESLLPWDNHQVLAYGYQELEDGAIRIMLYDPNYPGQDDVYIEAKGVQIEKPGKAEFGMKAGQYKAGKHIHNLHGFMYIPYEYNNPPDYFGAD